MSGVGRVLPSVTPKNREVRKHEHARMRFDPKGGPHETEYTNAGSSSRLEQGEIAWPEIAVEAEGDLEPPSGTPTVLRGFVRRSGPGALPQS